ncbi:MAG: glycosyltransferase WbuB [Deltaproteobacteria bacterium RBG_16_71_12]|nr:MAG: glycosyltransferase WbuB [Deltaproteobacteria bacterium RBG_16_71_12]
MRLLVVSQYFWPEIFRVNDLVAELAARGHEVTVLTGAPNYPEGEVFPEFREHPERFASYHGARVLRVPMLARGTTRVRLALNYASFALSGALVGPWRLRDATWDAIFVFQTSPITAALPALLLRRLEHTPVLLWVLDLWPESLSAVGAVRDQRLLDAVGRLVSFIYRRCDLILAQSRAFVANIERWAGSTERVRYFPGWAEAVFVDQEVATLAPELAAFREKFKVMFAGNIGEAQDLPAVLDAAERLRAHEQIAWLIVGDGRAAGALRADIERRGLQERVHLLGRFPLERMPSFFAGADALLVSLKADPIFASTIPGRVQSYLAAGVPILGMLDGEGARVIVEAGAGLTARAGDGRALADNVLALAGMSPEERAAMGARGKAFGAREFDRKVLIDRLETLVAEAVERRRTHS